MAVSFASELLTDNQITDYLVRVVEPKIATIPGVQRGRDGLARSRVWLKPDRMTALGVTASDVHLALQSNNVLRAGSTKGQMAHRPDSAHRPAHAGRIRRLVVCEEGGAIVRLGDIADVELGSRTRQSVRINGDAPRSWASSSRPTPTRWT